MTSQIYAQIKAHISEAMKEKKSFVLSTLRFLDSEIQRKALDSQKPITDDLVISVLEKGVKQRNESIEQFTKGNRPDLVQKEMTEKDIYKKYLPEAMSEDQIKNVIMKVYESVKENPNKNAMMGLIMKAIMSELKGKADGKLVSKLVQEVINK
jgi:uncharacterized protein